MMYSQPMVGFEPTLDLSALSSGLSSRASYSPPYTAHPCTGYASSLPSLLGLLHTTRSGYAGLLCACHHPRDGRSSAELHGLRVHHRLLVVCTSSGMNINRIT